MNYQMQMGYQQPYVEEVVIVENSRGMGPYYNQPLIVQPQPQVVIVQDPYANQAASN
jgi:hypothetical protein